MYLNVESWAHGIKGISATLPDSPLNVKKY